MYYYLFLFVVSVVLVMGSLFLYIDIINSSSNSKKLAVVRDVAKRNNSQKADETGKVLERNYSLGIRTEVSEQHRRHFIKTMMRFAWSNYEKYAWGENELRPISKVAFADSVFGNTKLGATIIDSMDILYIMGFTEEFLRARDWVARSFDLRKSTKDLSVFETNIRFVGGLLSAFALSQDQVFLHKAREVADLLLPAFDASPLGIPASLINVQTGTTHNWAGCSVLSEFGSLELEFAYLSHLTGNQTYASKCQRLRNFVTQLDKPDGLYPNFLNPQNGSWCGKQVSVGNYGDSFYEYLLKTWIFYGKSDVHLKMVYANAIQAIEQKLLYKSKPSNLWYFAELKDGTELEHKMDHLACYIAGTFALQSMHETNETTRIHYLHLAEEIAHTCHESYRKTVTGLGPETFHFTRDAEAQPVSKSESFYMLRPEAIESWFYLWRVTRNETYRDWCWEAAQAIEVHCRVAAGYSGILNVNDKKPEHDDVQHSFFLAETLKYLYLTFSDSDEIPLDQWIFNTVKLQQIMDDDQ